MRLKEKKKHINLFYLLKMIKYYFRRRIEYLKYSLKFLTGFFIINLFFSSCVSREEFVYFQHLKKIENQVDTNFSSGLNIKPNDLLTISVSAREIEAALPFNLPVVSGGSVMDAKLRIAGSPQMQTYLVNQDGKIQFPILGEIVVKGLNRKELSAKLEMQIAEYVQKPIVNVRIVNFQVSVLGEVNRPGTFDIQDEYLSLPKALGLAGDLTIYGKRKNILVVRETTDGKKVHTYLDLTDADIVNSPFYYLQQNDVVYVEPNGPQRQSANYNRNASVYISIASVLVSVAVLLTR